MSSKRQLESLVGFSVPADLVQIVDAFVKRAGGFTEGMELFREYLNLGCEIASPEDGRGYEATPIEFFPFMYTGGDGEMYGYVNAAPELDLPDLPMADFVPGENSGVIHIGNTTFTAIENIISYMHAHNDFAEVDLAFLKKIELMPSAMKAGNVRLLKGERYVRPKPALPKGWKHVMTSDGVGVVTEVARFRRSRAKQWSRDDSLQDFLAAAEKDTKAGFLGSALFHLKEAWWWKYHDIERQELADLTQRLVDVYNALGKSVLGDVLKKYFRWVK